jgi:hypothetical protein
MEVLKTRIAKFLDGRNGGGERAIPVSTLTQMGKNLEPLVTIQGRKNFFDQARRISADSLSHLSVGDTMLSVERQIAYIYPILHRNPVETTSDLTNHLRAFLGESEHVSNTVVLGQEIINGKVQIDLRDQYSKLSTEDFIELVRAVEGLENYLSKYKNYISRNYLARINNAWVLDYKTVEYDHPYPLIYPKKSGGYISIVPVVTQEDMPYIQQLNSR